MSKEEVRIGDVQSFCEKLARGIMKNHEKRFEDRIKAVNDACRTLNNAAARFTLGVKNAWGSMEKTSSEYGIRLAQTIQDRTQELARMEKATKFEEAEAFQEEAVKILNDIITTIRRYVPKMPRTLKTEMAGLNGGLARLEVAVRALGAALDESPGLKIRSLERDIRMLGTKHDELARLKVEETEIERGLSTVQESVKSLAHEEETLFSEPDFLELKRLEGLLGAKEDEIRQAVQTITKPLVKLERLADTRQEFHVDLRTLRSLVEKPVETVTANQSYVFTQLLGQLEDSLKKGELGVEERKRRKAEETIELVRKGAFDKLRDECSALQANIQETMRQLKGKGLIEKREELYRRMSESKSKMNDLIARKTELQRRMSDVSDFVGKQKSSVESAITKTLHHPVTIVTEE